MPDTLEDIQRQLVANKDSQINALEFLNKMLKDQIKELEEKLSLYEWKDIEDFKSDRVVFIYYENDLGKGRTVKALYAGKYEVEDEFSIGDFTEYDEKTGRNYWPEGWYEDVEAETGLDYSFHHLGDIKPTHFMEIPTPPTAQEGEE